MRRPNRTRPTRPGVLLELKPHERAFLKLNSSRGGYQDLENWMLEATRYGPVFLDPIRLHRLICCCEPGPNGYGPGGPNSRLRAACIPALRRVGIDLLPQWRAP